MRSFMALFLSMLNMFLMVGAAPTSNLSTSSGFIFVYSWGAGVIPARNGCLTAHGAWDYTDSACGTFQPVTTAPTITVAGTFKSSVGLCSFHSPDKSFVCCPSQIVGAPFKIQPTTNGTKNDEAGFLTNFGSDVFQYVNAQNPLLVYQNTTNIPGAATFHIGLLYLPNA